MPRDIITRTSHLMIDVQLLHEPFVGLAEGATFPDQREGSW